MTFDQVERHITASLLMATALAVRRGDFAISAMVLTVVRPAYEAPSGPSRIERLGRPGLVAAVGALVAAAGMAGLAAGLYPFAVVQGTGVGLFTAHLAPLFAANSPRSHLTRLQALVALAQAAPLLVANNVLGRGVDSCRRPGRRSVLCCRPGNGRITVGPEGGRNGEASCDS